MPLFHYVALNAEHKKLSGIIDAADEKAAQEKLAELGVVVINISTEARVQSEQEKNEAHKSIFEFEALDKNGKKVVGTIVGENILSAYKRLFEEYQLQVNALFNSNLSPEKKEKERAIGVSELHSQYELSNKKNAPKPVEETVKKDEHQTQVVEKVEITMKKMQEFLNKYGTQIKADERTALQGYLNQLMRIKDSTNLDHVVTTSKRMLEHVQERELFTEVSLRNKAGMEIKVETGELLKDLKIATSLNQTFEVSDLIKKMESNSFLKPLTKLLRSFSPEDTPEMKNIREQIKSANRFILAYLKIFITGKSEQSKSEAWNSLVTIRAEKKRLKQTLSSLKEKMKKQSSDKNPLEEGPNLIKQFFGWALCVYLFYYIGTYPITVKQIPNLALPNFLIFYGSSVISALTLFVFIIYCSMALRDSFFKQRQVVGLTIYVVGLIGFLFIAINLL